MLLRTEQGSSLVETLAAMTLILFALLAAAPLFDHAARGGAADADMGYVGAAAVKRMELLEKVSYLALTAGGSLSANVSSYSDTTSDPRVIVRWTITNDATLTLKTVRVRAIARRQEVGQVKQVILVTMRAR